MGDQIIFLLEIQSLNEPVSIWMIAKYHRYFILSWNFDLTESGALCVFFVEQTDYILLSFSLI